MSCSVDVLERYERLPARTGAAAQVLMMTSSDETSVADLARAIGSDPVFAARVLTFANSAYYGLRGRISTLQYAIAVLGFRTISAIAITLTGGMERHGSVPSGFWRQAVTAATASNVMSWRLGALPGDAFSLGLLHTIGSAILHQAQPIPGLCLPFPPDEAELEAAELSLYGMTHAQAAERVLKAWDFPPHLVKLIADHHQELQPDATPLERALHASRVLTDVVLSPNPDLDRSAQALVRISKGRFEAAELPGLALEVSEQSAVLYGGMTEG